MKELLEECKKSDRDDLFYLFWYYYNENRFQESYFIIHYMLLRGFNINFLDSITADRLRAEIE